MQDPLADIRAQRNSSILRIKNQEVKRRYASGKVQIDIPGTEAGMTSNTILAVPAHLVAKSGVTLAKRMTIGRYSQAGPDAELLSRKVVDLQNNMADVDEALDTVIKTGSRAAGVTNTNIASKAQTTKPRVDFIEPACATQDTDFGRVVTKKKRASSVCGKPSVDLVNLAKTLLKH